MYIWPTTFARSRAPMGTIADLLDQVCPSLHDESGESHDFRQHLPISLHHSRDAKCWSLNANGLFSVKSFYGFLNDRGMRCSVSPIILKSLCPKKIIFMWLVWDNKILTLDKLADKRCNRLPTTTCVLCHSNCESVDHLFISCPFIRHIWHHFGRLLGLSIFPSSVRDMWGVWRRCLHDSQKAVWDTLSRAILWFTWLERNDRIFNYSVQHPTSVIHRIIHTFLIWVSAAPEGKRIKLEDSARLVKRSLEFTEPDVTERVNGEDPDAIEEN